MVEVTTHVTCWSPLVCSWKTRLETAREKRKDKLELDKEVHTDEAGGTSDISTDI